MSRLKFTIVAVFLVFLAGILAITLYTYNLLGEDVSLDERSDALVDPQEEVFTQMSGLSWKYETVSDSSEDRTNSYRIVFPVFFDEKSDLYNQMIKHVIVINDKDSFIPYENYDINEAIAQSESVQAFSQKTSKEFLDFCVSLQSGISEVEGIVLPCEKQIDISITNTSNNLVIIDYITYLYYGGVNGESILNTYNLFIYDDNFQLLKLEDIIVDGQLDTLLEIADNVFRFKFNVSVDESLNGIGFNFDDNKFALSSNDYSFRFEPDGLLFSYALGEISSYSDGLISFIIPYTLLYNVMKPKFLQQIDSIRSVVNNVGYNDSFENVQ